MAISTLLLYPVFFLGVFISTLIFIPRKVYKSYFLYGFLVGGLGDIIAVAIFQNILHIIWFKNLGLFNVFGQMALSPPSWTVTVMIFLYFLPQRRSFLYPYVATWAMYSVAYAQVVRNAGLYDFARWFSPVPMYFVFLGWWIFSAWLFIKTSPLYNSSELPENRRKRRPAFFRVSPQAANKLRRNK